MPRVWFALKKSLNCKSEPSEVHEPTRTTRAKGNLGTILTKKGGRSGCSRSIANLKDVIHGSMRNIEKPANCSPRSIGSSEFLNPIAHEVVLSDSRCEFRITGFGGFGGGDGGGGLGSTYLGNLRPGTPGPRGGHHALNSHSPMDLTPWRKPNSLLADRGGGGSHHFCKAPNAPHGNDANGSSACHRCSEKFGRWEDLEAHHLSKHAVTELMEGDSSRKIVEIICRASWLKSESTCGRIERVLKVHSTQRTLSRFEEYRETVKSRASKLPKKHPRCLADGNELLRFHGTTVFCPLGAEGSSNLCSSEKCSVCRIVERGFSSTKELKGSVGVFTASTSWKALESIETAGDGPCARKALLVCRVIAGRVHKPLDDYQAMAGSGFDSLAGKVGPYSNIEEMYVLNPRALLPCFVVICKP